MREFVRIGTPEQIRAFREGWMARAQQLADELALPYTLEVASDPFFGRVGQMMAVSQVQQCAEVRAADPLLPRGEAHRLHELQLPPRSFRPGLGPA